MAPIGLGISISGSVYGGASNAVAVAIEDYMWTGYSNGGVAGEIWPTPTTYDFNDTWDLDYAQYSINFNGTNGYIDIGDTYQSTIRGSFTISAWAKLDDLSAGHTLVGAEVGAIDQFQIFHYSVGNKIRVYFEGDSEDFVMVETDAAVFDTVDVWKHITVTVTKNSGGNTGIVIYVNGSAVDSTPTAALTEANHNAYTSTRSLYIGACNDDGTADNFWDGNIHEFAIWSEALTAANVFKTYNTGIAFDYTEDDGDYDNSDTLVGYWRFNEGSGTVAIDLGGSNISSLQGGATYSNVFLRDYMPQAVGDISDEGYWDLDANLDVQPEMHAL